MNRTHIASTPRSQLNALRFQGILVSDNYAQLSSMLERNLSPEHARFFAEPVQDADAATVDWYSQAPGELVPLSAVPPEKQAAARTAIQKIASEISAFADSLKADSQGSKAVRGNILALALSYPSEEYIYMAGEQPVLTGWGYTSATMGMEPEPLIRLGVFVPPPASSAASSDEQPKPPLAVAPPQRRGGCLSALLAFLLGLLILLGLYLLLMLLVGPAGCPMLENAPMPPGCVKREPVAPVEPADGGRPEEGKPEEKPAQEAPREEANGPSTDLVTALTAETEKEESLRRQIEGLRKQLVARADQCVPPVKPQPEPEPVPEPKPEPPVVSEPEPEPEPEPEEPPSLAELMPTTPEPEPEPAPKPKPKAEAPKPKPVEKPKAEPKPEPKPKPKPEEKPKTAQKPSKNLVIPKDAARNNDLSFLEGCWTNATTLRDGRTRKPIRSTYCFDKNGRGTRTEQGIGHDLRCRSTASAGFVNGRLRISATEAICSSGGKSRGRYPKEAILCDRTVDGTANCYESQNDRWKAKLQRVK